ncbi:STE like transcription factor-domain-containing protein [Mycena polygramma]|nr:STE like transcription factor-domain-containing protein [Mycena polygramma]
MGKDINTTWGGRSNSGPPKPRPKSSATPDTGKSDLRRVLKEQRKSGRMIASKEDGNAANENTIGAGGHGLSRSSILSRSLTAQETERLVDLDRLRVFLATAPSHWDVENDDGQRLQPEGAHLISFDGQSSLSNTTATVHPGLNRFLLPSQEYVSCVLWNGVHYITGPDIVRVLCSRFEAFSRPVRNIKKFEEGIISDLKSLKPGTDACLEEAKSPFVELLFKYQCTRTQKKQRVFYWFSVPHDRLFLDALERDLKREKMGLEPTTQITGEPALSFTYDIKKSLYEQFILNRSNEHDGGDLAMSEPSSSHASSNDVHPGAHRGVEDERSLTTLFAMFSLFEGSPTYKQRREGIVKKLSTLGPHGREEEHPLRSAKRDIGAVPGTAMAGQTAGLSAAEMFIEQAKGGLDGVQMGGYAAHPNIQEQQQPNHHVQQLQGMLAAFHAMQPVQQQHPQPHPGPLHGQPREEMMREGDTANQQTRQSVPVQVNVHVEGLPGTAPRSGASTDTEIESSNEIFRATKSSNGTFAIVYSPKLEMSDTQYSSFTSNDLACSQANLGIGGCLISVHDPEVAASWLENNWDDPLLTSIRDSNCGGPLPWMLSPVEPALVLFGSSDDPIVVNMARSLAASSGFPVVVRSSNDNPASTLLIGNANPNEHGRTDGPTFERGTDRHGEDDRDKDESAPERRNEGHGEDDRDEDESAPERSGDRGRGDDDMPANNEPGVDQLDSRPEDEERLPRYNGAHGDGGGDDGGGGGPSAVDGKWESPLHRTRVKLSLKPNTTHTYAVVIGYTFKFVINRDTEIPIDLDDMSHSLSRPEVTALVDFKIETRLRETQIDRSYANIGFVAHREQSIVEREFLHRGFDNPEKLYTRGQSRQIQRGIKANLGFSQGGPLATAGLSYNRNNEIMLEATDSKVMPKCRVDHEIGDEWDEDKKSYTSYNITYQPQDVQLEAGPSEFHPLEVKGSENPLPQISFMNRNQVLIWVTDTKSKARIRGIVVLMSVG